MIVLSIAGVVMAGVVQFLGRTARQTQEMKAIAARDTLKADLKGHLQFPPNLASSLPDNPAFLACMQESTDGRSDCISTSEDVSYPFRLLKASRKAAIVLAGPPDAPVHYSIDGVRCDKKTSSCPLEAVVSFRAHCPKGKDACDLAAYFEFTVTVGGRVGAAARPLLKPSRGEVIVEADRIALAAEDFADEDSVSSTGVTFGSNKFPSLRPRYVRGVTPLSSGDGLDGEAGLGTPSRNRDGGQQAPTRQPPPRELVPTGGPAGATARADQMTQPGQDLAGVFSACTQVVAEGCGLPVGAKQCSGCVLRGSQADIDVSNFEAPCVKVTLQRCE